MTNVPVLVVDDNELNRELVAALLEHDGYEVRSARSGDETLALFAEGFRPRLILMDIQMPGMDGLELTKRIKAEPGFGNPVIVALTAYAMVGDAERILGAGCDGYMTKPLDTRTFSGRLKEFLG